MNQVGRNCFEKGFTTTRYNEVTNVTPAPFGTLIFEDFVTLVICTIEYYDR